LTRKQSGKNILSANQSVRLLECPLIRETAVGPYDSPK